MHLPKTQVLTLAKAYPAVESMAELKAHFERHQPVARICEYLLQLTNDIISGKMPTSLDSASQTSQAASQTTSPSDSSQAAASTTPASPTAQ